VEPEDGSKNRPRQVGDLARKPMSLYPARVERRSPHAQQQLLSRHPAPRGGRSTPSSYGYRGPDRPYPEVRRRVSRENVPNPPAPRAARAAGILGIAGAIPLALFVGAAVGLGGLSGDDSVEWWLYPLLAAPVAQLGGAIELLSGRSWRLLVLACLPATALFGYLLYAFSLDGDRLGLGYYTLLLGATVPALVLAALPSVRRWVAGRRRARTVSRPAR
jgi:hypothetical protein